MPRLIEEYVESDKFDVSWQPDGAPSAIDFSEDVTKFSFEESVPTKDLDRLRGKLTQVNKSGAERKAKISGLAIKGSPTPYWLSPDTEGGAKGKLSWTPGGSQSGAARLTADGYISARNHDVDTKNVTWTMDVIINGAAIITQT